MADLKSLSMVAVGRKYGVSDNAVRKWMRWYEYRREAPDADCHSRPGYLVKGAQNRNEEPKP